QLVHSYMLHGVSPPGKGLLGLGISSFIAQMHRASPGALSCPLVGARSCRSELYDFQPASGATKLVLSLSHSSRSTRRHGGTSRCFADKLLQLLLQRQHVSGKIKRAAYQHALRTYRKCRDG